MDNLRKRIISEHGVNLCNPEKYYITECYDYSKEDICPGTCAYTKKMQKILEGEKRIQFNEKIFQNLNQIGIEFI
ncbi:MAG: hypothetical protein PVJ67_05560 [Candidatus Pacearchaeota archaeon]|jgi:hypothetical protein